LQAPTDRIDAVLEADEINLELYQELQGLAPFGVGNPEPRFLLPGAQLIAAHAVGGDKRHLKLQLAAGERRLEAIGFNMAELLPQVADSPRLNPVFKLSRNDWGGRSRIELELEDLLEDG